MENNLIQIEHYTYNKEIEEYDYETWKIESREYNSKLEKYNKGQLAIKPESKRFGYIFKGKIEKRYCAKIYHKGLDKTLEVDNEIHLMFEYYLNQRIGELETEWKIYLLQQRINLTKQMDEILNDGLRIPKQINWNDFKRNDTFDNPNPKIELENELRNLVEYNNELASWELGCKETNQINNSINLENNRKLKSYEDKKRFIEAEILKQESDWFKQKEEFISHQNTKNKNVDDFRDTYLSKNSNCIEEYSKLILEYSKYPTFIEKKYDVTYNQDNKILIVEYALPSIDVLPTLKEFKWIKGELKEYHITEIQLQKNFEKIMYSICLRTIYELFHTDIINALEAICFNGWVNSINKATGKRENNCILSIQVIKEEFEQIDLSNVDPKVCFKSFKGISSSKLSTVTSIQPIIQINRNDKRFVDSHNVTQSIDNSTNLAAMGWEDFEHLIREVFEKEFQSNGGEVKVTQASRDGGVDAIAFDPDPIRGGKIVIQAKRYTNTVGVSAVRDLYGTVMNEGATKGILVTTSDYGSDSYEFAKGKPLTLLNGSNLLYLLEKHGHSAKIDIEEARRLLKE